jgi:hypothetical protein
MEDIFFGDFLKKKIKVLKNLLMGFLNNLLFII